MFPRSLAAGRKLRGFKGHADPGFRYIVELSTTCYGQAVDIGGDRTTPVTAYRYTRRFHLVSRLAVTLSVVAVTAWWGHEQR